MKRPITWILVADGGRARIFQDAGRHRIEEKSDIAVPHPPTRNLMSDRPGRTFDSAGHGRHAKEPPTDAHEKAEFEFLRSISKKLGASCQKKEFERLVVIAPPRALGQLRSMFPGQLTNTVTQEIPHDLTGFATPALESYLREHDII